MLLFLLLIVPLIFWLIPVARMQQREFSGLRQFSLHFTAMLITCVAVGVVLWSQHFSYSPIFITILIISVVWGMVFYLIEQRNL